MNATEKCFANIVEMSLPTTLLSIGRLEAGAPKIAQQWALANQYCKWQHLDPKDIKGCFSPEKNVELVLVSDTLETLPQSEGSLLLGMMRNFGARQIAVSVANESPWTFNDFIGLGFRKFSAFENAQSEKTPNTDRAISHDTIYDYKLDSYNHKRSWNTPRFWANPEMWNKARW